MRILKKKKKKKIFEIGIFFFQIRKKNHLNPIGKGAELDTKKIPAALPGFNLESCFATPLTDMVMTGIVGKGRDMGR